MLLIRVFSKNNRAARGKVNNEASQVNKASQGAEASQVNDKATEVRLGFFDSARAMLLLSAVLLTPITIASASSLLSLDAAARVIYALALLFPLAIFFYLLESWCLSRSDLLLPNLGKANVARPMVTRPSVTRPRLERETSALELFFARAFSTSTRTNLWGVDLHRINLCRLATILFASGFLLFLLFSMLPQMSSIFFEHSSRLFITARLELAPTGFSESRTWLSSLFFGLSLRQAVVVITLVLVTTLSFPLLFSRPLRIIIVLLCLLLPLALIFYGTLCFFMLEQSLAYAEQASGVELGTVETLSLSALGSFLPSFTMVEFSSLSFTSFLLMFRSAFGYFALACVASSASTRSSSWSIFNFGKIFSKRLNFSFGKSFSKKLNLVFSFFLLLFLCFTLLLFIMLTLLVILATGSWTLGELGFGSLYAAFASLYPGESWLLASSLALLSLTALLGFSAFCILAMRLLSRDLFTSSLERHAIFLFLPLCTWGAFSESLTARSFVFGRLELLLESLGDFGFWLSASVFVLALVLFLLRRLRLRLCGLPLRRATFSEDLARGF